MLKDTMRKELKALRNHFSQEYVTESSRLVSERIIKSSLYQNADVIMGYLAFGNEISVDKVLLAALADGKRVAVPYIISSADMYAVEIFDFENFKTDRYGIRSAADQRFKVDEKIIDLVLVPGVAYDISGNRLGMGAGYYDRFLARCINAVTCGVAYEKLMQDSIPAESFDIPVNYLVCENKSYKF